MNKGIVWKKWGVVRPVEINKVYLVKDTSGNVYLDRWIHEDTWVNEIDGPVNYVKDRFENTHSGFIVAWAETEGVLLDDYIDERGDR